MRMFLGVCLLVVLSSCASKSSGSSSSSSGSNAGVVAAAPPSSSIGDYFMSLGGGTFEDASTGQIIFGSSLASGDYYVPSSGVFIPGQGGIGYDRASPTKDVDLQSAQLTQNSQDDRAQAIANQFQTSFDSALQLVQIADKAQKMATQGQITAEDREAITESVLAVAGLTPDEVDQAVEESQKGDFSAANDMIDKAAQNLGMPSSASLRDQLLPVLANPAH